MAAKQPHLIKVFIASTKTRSIVDCIEPNFSEDGRLVDHCFKIPPDDEDRVFLPFVQARNIFAMFGPSGSGKTTMIQTLMSLFCSVQPAIGYEEEGCKNPVLVISNKEDDPSLQSEHDHSFILLKDGMRSPKIYWKKIDWWKTFRPDLGDGITIDKLFSYYETFHNGRQSHGLVIIDDLIVRNNRDDDNVASFVSNFLQMYRQSGFTIFISKHSMASRSETQTKKEADYSIIFPNSPLPGLKDYLMSTMDEETVIPIMKQIKHLKDTEYENKVGVSYFAVRRLGGLTMSRKSIKRESEEDVSSVNKRPQSGKNTKKRKYAKGQEEEQTPREFIGGVGHGSGQYEPPKKISSTVL